MTEKLQLLQDSNADVSGKLQDLEESSAALQKELEEKRAELAARDESTRGLLEEVAATKAQWQGDLEEARLARDTYGSTFRCIYSLYCAFYPVQGSSICSDLRGCLISGLLHEYGDNSHCVVVSICL